MTLSGVLTTQAATRADSPALVDVSHTWTYDEAAHRSGQISASLIASGVSRGDRVGVHCAKGADGFLAMHAVVSMGAVAVPLDPSSPPSRLASICARLGIDVVVSHAPKATSLAGVHELHPLRVAVGVDLPGAASTVVSSQDLDGFDPASPVSVDPSDRAYIITTSGSTGEPKGIVHTHASGVAYAEMTHRTYDMTAADRVSDIAPHHFDISTHSLWATPMIGATSVVINEAYQRLPASHSQRLQDEAVTIWYSVPFLLQQLVLRGDLANRDLSAMRWVKFGGEVISPQIIAEMMGHCPNARFANAFGPAEVNQCSVAVFDSPPPSDRSVSVGVPVDKTEILALDPEIETASLDDAVATGERGEMWVHTPQMMVGYWGAPEMNAAKIQDIDGKAFYRSGDLISFDEAGEMTFYGRIDHQVKVRGFRIELEGIELALEQLGGSGDGSENVPENVIVGVLRAQSGEDELVAGLLGVSETFDQSEFLRSAASVLPTYAVPTRTVILESPMFTGSGKLDRRALRDRTVEKANNETVKEDIT